MKYRLGPCSIAKDKQPNKRLNFFPNGDSRISRSTRKFCLRSLLCGFKPAGAFKQSIGHFPIKDPFFKTPSESGFATLFLLASLPLVLIFLGLSFRQFQIILVERKTRALCRLELLHTQKIVGQSIQELFELNRAVIAAKALKQAALIAMAAAAASENAPAFTLAEQQYEVAIHTLNTLRLTQKSLILKATFELNQGPLNAQRAIRKTWNLQPNGPLAIQKLQGTFFPQLPSKLSVRPLDESDPYPEYELEDDFSNNQAVQVSWKTSWQHQGEKRWSNQDWIFNGGCGATLLAEANGTFEPRLSKDKFSSKSFLFW